MLTGGILNAFMWTDFCSCLPNFTPVPSRYVSSRIIKPIFMGFIMRKKKASVVGRVREWSLNHKL